MKGKRKEMTDSDEEINGHAGRCREITGNEWDIHGK